VLAENVHAELVDGGPPDFSGRGAELLEAGGDLLGGLVGEGEGDDALRRNAVRFDEKADALDEAECLPRPGACYEEDWLSRRLDRLELRGSCRMPHVVKIAASTTRTPRKDATMAR
jgi:hypothetical protein